MSQPLQSFIKGLRGLLDDLEAELIENDQAINNPQREKTQKLQVREIRDVSACTDTSKRYC